MTDKQSGPNMQTLAKLASVLADQRTALFLDFDGTLVELASAPDAIAVRDGLGNALIALSQRLEGRLAIVSGRSIEDLETYLGPLPIAMAGSHGAAIRAGDGSALGRPAQGVTENVREALRVFAQKEGLRLENKAHGVALHFRSAPKREADAHSFADALAQEHGIATKRGKCVVELVERGIDKGAAVDVFMGQPAFQSATPFFIGDDVTDEDGFAACNRHGGAGILVGTREATCAKHTLSCVNAVHNWLELTF